jgi:hypothetical protein
VKRDQNTKQPRLEDVTFATFDLQQLAADHGFKVGPGQTMKTAITIEYDPTYRAVLPDDIVVWRCLACLRDDRYERGTRPKMCPYCGKTAWVRFSMRQGTSGPPVNARIKLRLVDKDGTLLDKRTIRFKRGMDGKRAHELLDIDRKDPGATTKSHVVHQLDPATGEWVEVHKESESHDAKHRGGPVDPREDNSQSTST